MGKNKNVSGRLVGNNGRFAPRWRKSRRGSKLILSAVLISAAAMTVGVNQSSSGSTPKTDEQKFDAQYASNRYLGTLRKLSATDIDIARALAGAHYDFDGGTLSVYVVDGVVPDQMRAIAADQSITDRIEFLPAKYSVASLQQARDDVIQRGTVPGQASPMLGRAYVVGIALKDDGSGLRIDLDRADQGKAASVASLASSRAFATPMSAGVTPSDVQVAYVDKPHDAAGTRNADVAPWTGGALMHNLGYCSTGFTVRLGSVGYAVLTVAHCPSRQMGSITHTRTTPLVLTMEAVPQPSRTVLRKSLLSRLEPPVGMRAAMVRVTAADPFTRPMVPHSTRMG